MNYFIFIFPVSVNTGNVKLFWVIKKSYIYAVEKTFSHLFRIKF